MLDQLAMKLYLLLFQLQIGQMQLSVLDERKNHNHQVLELLRLQVYPKKIQQLQFQAKLLL